MANMTERRGTTRYPAANDRTVVQIMDEKGTRITRARLANVSAGGALILTDRQPELNRPLHLRLESAAKLGWIMAIPVRSGPTREVGVRFARPCPPDFLWAATRGTQSRLVAAGEEETQCFGETSTAHCAPSQENPWKREIGPAGDESRSENVPWSTGMGIPPSTSWPKSRKGASHVRNGRAEIVSPTLRGAEPDDLAFHGEHGISPG